MKKETKKRKPRSKKSNTRNTKERKSSKKRTEDKAKTIIFQSEETPVLCTRCNKPKRPKDLPEWERGFCRCWVKTKYREIFCSMVIDFFENAKNEIAVDRQFYQPKKDGEIFITPDGYEHGGIKSEFTKILATKFPTFQRWNTEVLISESTRRRWVETYPEFRNACEIAQEIQHAIWLENSMAGIFNGQFAIFFGKNCLGYKDKAEIKHSGDKENPIQILIPDNNRVNGDKTTERVSREGA